MKKKTTNENLISEIKGLLNQKAYVGKISTANEKELKSILYEEGPVDIDTFVTSKQYLGQNLYGLSEAQRKVLEVADDFENGINYLILWVGKGGGKDFITRIIFLRLVYKLLCMRSPHAYLGIPSTEIITFLNVAASADQAQNVFFEPLKNMLKSSGESAFIKFGFNPETDIKERMIVFPKNIILLSGHSEADTLEGKNVLVAVADEIDAKTFRNPEKMWTMLRSSSRSRFFGKEKIMAISYMRFSESNGMIKKLYEEHVFKKDSFVAKYPTWVFNPNPNITKETFASEYELNPEEARTIYECEPPEYSIDSFFKDIEKLRKAMKPPEDRWPLKFPLPPEDFYRRPLSEVIREVDGSLVELDPYNLEFHDWFVGKPGVDYFFIGDPGLGKVADSKTGDSFGLTIGHREYILSNNGKILVRPVVDFVFRFTGHMFKEKEIQIEAIKRLIENLLRRGFSLRYFYFDQWNSAYLGQWIRDRIVGAQVTYSKYVEYKHYKLLKEKIYSEGSEQSPEVLENAGIDFFYHPIIFWELSNLIEDKVKGKIDHKPDTSKDISDTLAMFVWMAEHYPKNDFFRNIDDQSEAEISENEIIKNLHEHFKKTLVEGRRKIRNL